MLYTTLSGA